MKILSVFLFSALICCACGRGKYYITGIFSKGDVDNMKTMALDSTYQFYLREVNRVKNNQNEYVLKANGEQTDTAEKTRIEVEYLLVSRVHKNAIYISTVPDKYQHYYSSNLFADTLINAYDFSTFHFGKIAADGESIFFSSVDGKRAVNWDIRPFINDHFPKKIFIREIAIQRKDNVENVILINKSLEEPLSFSRQKNFTIIFERPGRKSVADTAAAGFCKLSYPKIYFSQVNHGFDLFFRFDKNLNDSGDSAIRFDYHRTRYPPAREEH